MLKLQTHLRNQIMPTDNMQYALPRACSSPELCFASAVAIASSGWTTAWSAEEGGVTGSSAVLDSVTLFTPSASWASFPLASLGNWSWSSRKSRSSVTEGTSRGTPCPPPSAITRGVDRWVPATWMGDLQQNLGDPPLDLAAVRVCLDLLRSSMLSLDFRAMPLNWVTHCTFPTCKHVARYVAVDKECQHLFTCVLASPKFPLCISHRPIPSHSSRCVWPAPIWWNTSTFELMDLPSSLNSAFCNAKTAVGEPAQGVGSGGLLYYCGTWCSGLSLVWVCCYLRLWYI